ncbi:diacylglycerol kinase [Gordonia sp. TBRC 11910]|uniref:Diacylglycerol kinase n=1 Tax=Gordonia asplenii TaxID=2725283 RepID=A0A848KYW6_9ACTN|nr:diacylglycerol kinase family protein [Gordonia asplenii]NMO03412.1 diacylglycerol kinase [Gordonia asplenii]
MSHIKKIALLVNPHSRHGLGVRVAEHAQRGFANRGVAVEVLTGSDAVDAERLAVDACNSDDIDAVVVVGGDGSIRLALDAAVAAGGTTPIGVIPAGSGNDLARALRLPIDDVSAAVDVIVGGGVTRIDLGRVTLDGGATTTFVTVAATGFDADVTARAVSMRWPKGQSRYTLAAARELIGLGPRRYRIVVDGEPKVDADVVFAAVGNTRSYGGGMLVTPDASLTDGQLDVTLAAYQRRLGRITIARIFPRVFTGTHVEHSLVRQLRGARIEISAEPTALVSVDGDVVGSLPAVFDVLPSAVGVLTAG